MALSIFALVFACFSLAVNLIVAGVSVWVAVLIAGGICVVVLAGCLWGLND